MFVKEVQYPRHCAIATSIVKHFSSLSRFEPNPLGVLLEVLLNTTDALLDPFFFVHVSDTVDLVSELQPSKV